VDEELGGTGDLRRLDLGHMESRVNTKGGREIEGESTRINYRLYGIWMNKMEGKLPGVYI